MEKTENATERLVAMSFIYETYWESGDPTTGVGEQIAKWGLMTGTMSANIIWYEAYKVPAHRVEAQGSGVHRA